MGKIFRYHYQIPFFETDVTQQVKLPHFLSLALQVSGIQSAELGVSDEDVFNQYGLVWVITDYDVSIERLPKFAEEVIIETEAIWYNKLFCYRAFRVYDQDENLLMDIMTTFVVMDFETRKVQPVPDELVVVYGAEKDKKILRGPRYSKFEATDEHDYRVRFFDLDMNGHVNNSKYLEWVLDSLDLDFLTQHQIKKLNVKYVKEVSYGSSINSRMMKDDLTTYHEVTSDGKTHAQAIIEWRKNEV